MAKFSNKMMGKEVGDGAEYAVPHTMAGKLVSGKPAQGVYMHCLSSAENTGNSPLMSGVSIGQRGVVKTSGIEMRGAGAATKGRISRGPMA